MITALYASLLMLLLIWLSFKVINQRRSGQVAYADGGIKALQIARSAHGNAVENIPITLILMALLEYNGGSIYLVHLCGILILAGRYIHAKGILKENLDGRKKGMIMTFASQLILVILNLIYLPFDKLFG